MSDGSAERTLALAAFDVDVDPLVVAGQVGEGVDHFLGDLDLVAPIPVLVGGLSVDGVDVVKSEGEGGHGRDGRRHGH